MNECIHYNVLLIQHAGSSPNLIMAMNPADSIFCLEWTNACQHLIKRDTDRIIICSIIKFPVHSSGLLRRYIAKRSFQPACNIHILFFSEEFCRNFKIYNLNFFCCSIENNVTRINIFMYHILTMNKAYAPG